MALGEQLRQARQERKRTPSQIAASTRMKVQIVEAIEREDFSRIAAPIYGKGFIKLYAEEVGLDPAPLIREYVDCFVNRDSEPSLSKAAISRGANGKRDAQEARRSKTKSIGDREITEIVPEPPAPEPALPEPSPEPAVSASQDPVSVPAGGMETPLGSSPAPLQSDLFAEPEPVEESPSRSGTFFNPETQPGCEPRSEVRTEPPPANTFSFFEEPEPLPPGPPPPALDSIPEPMDQTPAEVPVDLPAAAEPEIPLETSATTLPGAALEAAPGEELPADPVEPASLSPYEGAVPLERDALAIEKSEPDPEPEAEAPSDPEPDVEPVSETEPVPEPESLPPTEPAADPEPILEPGPVGSASDYIPFAGPDPDMDSAHAAADSLADLEREFDVEDGDVVSRLVESDDPSVLTDEGGASARTERLKAGWQKFVQESIQPCVALWCKLIRSLTEKRRLAQAWQAEKEFDRSTRPPSPYGSMAMMLTGACGTILVVVLLVTCIARCSREEDPTPAPGGAAGEIQLAVEPPSPYID